MASRPLGQSRLASRKRPSQATPAGELFQGHWTTQAEPGMGGARQTVARGSRRGVGGLAAVDHQRPLHRSADRPYYLDMFSAPASSSNRDGQHGAMLGLMDVSISPQGEPRSLAKILHSKTRPRPSVARRNCRR
jgi:hypothetical protein